MVDRESSADGRRQRVSIDIGGTFTDLVFYDEQSGLYETRKVPSTPQDLAAGVLAGLDSVVPTLDNISFSVHGSTIALNTFLQRKGERVLLLATAGVEDVYHIARGSRARMYDIHYRKPRPLVPREDIVGIRGRIDHLGKEIMPLNETDLQSAINRVKDEDFGALAVALLFSYLNPAHELYVENLLKSELPGVPVSLSHKVAREWREYERTSSTVLDAYVGAAVKRYVQQLESEVNRRQLKVPLHVMQSNGGIMTAEAASDRPLQTLLSGPVGGSAGGSALAKALERPNLLCIDMGGTSFDVSLIVDGEPEYTSEASLDGFPILIPIVNIHTIGAGGGSIAYVEGGGLRVGPESAGADPGPACYGQGGNEPTVTDANLVLGRIDPAYFLDGQMTLDVKAAEQAIARLSESLDLEQLNLAEGIVDVINAKMAQAIRTITVEQGIEPRDFAIVAFGGAGPMHAAFLARELEIEEVFVPPVPGTFSAWGMLQTVIRHDFVLPFYRPLNGAAISDMRAALEGLEGDGNEMLAREGVNSTFRQSVPSVDMRYEGQEYTLNVAVRMHEMTDDGYIDQLSEEFHSTYLTRYGHANRDAPLEVVALRLAALGSLGHHDSLRPIQPSQLTSVPNQKRPVLFSGEFHDTAIFRRADVEPGFKVHGPAIIEEASATTVIPPECSARVDEYGCLLLSVGGDLIR